MGLVKGIDHVLVAAPVNCEEEARKFYGEILELKEVEKPSELKKRGGVWFQLEEQQLHIGVDKNFRAASKAHPAFTVEDLISLAIVMKRNDIEVITDELIEGTQRFFCKDPFGNRLEFLQRD